MSKRLIYIHLQPNAKREEVWGMYDEQRIKIAISTPPIDGKANEALIKFLSKKLKIAKSNIEIVKGLTSKDKTICIDSDEDIITKLI